jgi:biotin transport system ATP-binding protein
LAGRNGSGKTLLMRHLNGLEPIQQGSIHLEGQEISQHKELVQRVGLVFQNADSQFVSQTVEGEIAFGPANLRLTKTEINRRRELAIEQMGLGDFRKRHPHSLSGGEKRRLAIASVLAMEPRLLVLDEPFTGLDLQGVDQTLQCLLNLHQGGSTIL